MYAIENGFYLVYLVFQRYKFKSKSQLNYIVKLCYDGVFGISKIQIQKQITTSSHQLTTLQAVYLVFQRYKFKSKLQHVTLITLSLLILLLIEL